MVWLRALSAQQQNGIAGVTWASMLWCRFEFWMPEFVEDDSLVLARGMHRNSEHSTAQVNSQDCTAQLERPSVAERSIAWHSTAQHGIAQHGTEQHSTAPDSARHLGNDYKPGVNGHMPKALLQGRFHIWSAAMVEPQGQQAQYVLQRRSRVGLTWKAIQGGTSWPTILQSARDTSTDKPWFLPLIERFHLMW